MSDVSPSGVIGHAAQLRQLRVLIEHGRVPHALLFTGPSAVGKRSAAYAFAEQLLGGGSGGIVPATSVAGMDAAAITTLFRAGNHPDFHTAFREEGKRDLPVETIRELCGKLQLKPYYGTAAVAIIDEAETMSIAASNALLMTLEEPVRNTYLILVTSALQRLPETIVSRCQKVEFGFLSEIETASVLRRLLESFVPEAVIAEAIRVCEGSLGMLGLDRFVNPRTLQLTSEKEVCASLEQLLAQLSSQEQALRELFKDPAAPIEERMAHAILVATALTGDKEREQMSWKTMQKVLRQKLREAKSEDRTRWADALLRAVEGEQLCRERNTSAQLQLSSVLLQTV